jgi:hypothetical protein
MAASRRQVNNAPPAFATMASEGGGRAQAVGGYRKFGLTKLRLKGASEIADAAAKLQQWQAQLQEQEQALEHYRAVVARREQSLLVSEAAVLRQRKQLTEQQDVLRHSKAYLASAEHEVQALAKFQREQSLQARETTAQVQEKAEVLAKQEQDLRAKADVIARKQVIGAELLEAMRMREAQCRRREATVEEQASALSKRQGALSEWQTQVERLVTALAQQQQQQQLSTLSPPSSAPATTREAARAAQLAAAEEALVKRRAALQHRLTQVEAVESELEQRQRLVLEWSRDLEFHHKPDDTLVGNRRIYVAHRDAAATAAASALNDVTTRDTGGGDRAGDSAHAVAGCDSTSEIEAGDLKQLREAVEEEHRMLKRRLQSAYEAEERAMAHQRAAAALEAQSEAAKRAVMTNLANERQRLAEEHAAQQAGHGTGLL